MWWDNLLTLQQVCFIIGTVTGIFMLIQIVLMAVGMAGDGDMEYSGSSADTDMDIYNDGFASGLKILSVRTALAFFCVGSWLAYTMGFYVPWWAALLIGMAGGAVMAVIVAVTIRGFEKLQGEGNIIIENCIGKTAQVYLTVPANRSGQGKVNVCVQEKLTEFEAVTDGESVKTGAQVKVTGVASQGVLIVESFKGTPVEASVKPYAK